MGDYNRVSKGYYVDLLSQDGLQVWAISRVCHPLPNPKPPSPTFFYPKILIVYARL